MSISSMLTFWTWALFNCQSCSIYLLIHSFQGLSDEQIYDSAIWHVSWRPFWLFDCSIVCIIIQHRDKKQTRAHIFSKICHVVSKLNQLQVLGQEIKGGCTLNTSKIRVLVKGNRYRVQNYIALDILILSLLVSF